MAGGLTISTLNDSSGVLATQNGMSGIAKAWVNFNGSTGAIRVSFNVASITKNASGSYTVNFTNAMPSADYGFAGSAGTGATSGAGYTPIHTQTASTSRLITVDTAGNVVDFAYVCVAYFSS
jgi:hypothetical protein